MRTTRRSRTQPPKPLMAWFREMDGKVICTIAQVRPKGGKPLGAADTGHYSGNMAPSVMPAFAAVYLEIWNAAVAHTETVLCDPEGDKRARRRRPTKKKYGIPRHKG